MPNIPRGIEKLEEIQLLAELAKGRTHDDHEMRRPLMRQIQRESLRAIEALEAEEPLPSHPAEFIGDFLHPFGGNRQIGYRHTTLGAPGDSFWTDGRLADYFSRYSHMAIYAEANDNLAGLLGKPHVDYSFYEDPVAAVPFFEKVHSLGGHLWLTAMDQDSQKYQAYPTWKHRLFALIEELHVRRGLLDVLLTGIEIDKGSRWGAHPDWIIDMHRELKDRYPRLLLAVHFVGPNYMHVPHADIFALQLRWESFVQWAQARNDLRIILPNARQQYEHVVAFEYGQHRNATEDQASRLHAEIIVPELESHDLPITGGCGVAV